MPTTRYELWKQLAIGVVPPTWWYALRRPDESRSHMRGPFKSRTEAVVEATGELASQGIEALRVWTVPSEGKTLAEVFAAEADDD